MAKELQKTIQELKKRRDDLNTAINILEKELGTTQRPKTKRGRPRKNKTKKSPAQESQK